MKEFINLIINVLGQMENNQNIVIAKNNDNEYSFSGEGKDSAGTPYRYEITTKFLPIENVPENTDLQALQKQIEDLQNKFEAQKEGEKKNA